MPAAAPTPAIPAPQPSLSDFAPKILNFGEPTEILFESANFPSTAVVDLSGHFCDNANRKPGNSSIRITCTAANGTEGPVKISIKTKSGDKAAFAERMIMLRYAPATVSRISPLTMTQFDNVSITIAGQRLDTRLSVVFDDGACGIPTVKSSTTMVVECQPKGIGTRNFSVYGATGNLLMRNRIIVSAFIPPNTKPVLSGLMATSPVKSGAAIIGSFTISDPDGDLVKNLRVHVGRSFDGSDCVIDVGSYDGLQNAGSKSFSGCSAMTTAAATLYLKVEGRDSKGDQANVLRGAVSVSATPNTAPVVSALTATSPIPGGSPVSGSLTIGDADGDQIRNLRVHVGRSLDGSDCVIDIGVYDGLQNAGAKTFGGCAGMTAISGTLYLKVEARDSRGGRQLW